MKPNGLIIFFSKLTISLVVATLLLWSASMHADQAQYFYDELGRLVGVVDSAGGMQFGADVRRSGGVPTRHPEKESWN